MLPKRILVIGDYIVAFQSIKNFTQSDSMDVTYTMSEKESLNAISFGEYCLVIMCVQSFEKYDIDYLRHIRELKSMPIIVIAPKLTANEKIMLFHAGANVCLDAPVDITLCAAQADSLIQLYLDAKQTDTNDHPLVFGTELIINPVYRHVIINGEPLELTRTEFDLLYYMARHPNQIFTRQQLYQQVWNDDLGVGGENTVRSHIGNLYKKLADVGKNYIQNTRGVGYKFVPPAGKE